MRRTSKAPFGLYGKKVRTLLFENGIEWIMHNQVFDFAIAIDDIIYDWNFIQLLEQAAQRIGLTTYLIMPNNLKETIQKLQAEQIDFKFYYDRASDTSPEFLDVYDWVTQKNIPILDTIATLKRAADKATMHLEFIANGIVTPYTIIIPPVSKTEDISPSIVDLSNLGRPFIIKPANTTGGGRGVVKGAETLQDILQARIQYHNDKYLLQEKIVPLEHGGKRFWFRGFYACGAVECAWWNDLTHVYEPLTEESVKIYQLDQLFSIVKKIADICNLNFFSTEIAINQKREFVVIDYVNEICDMRLQSQHADGVPDEIVHNITQSIAAYVKG